MVKRKVFVKTDLTTPGVEYRRSPVGEIFIPPEAMPPANTTVKYRPGIGNDQFDFGRWYGAGFDQIVYACQVQIERFRDKQDSEVTVVTLRTYCQHGLKTFFNFLVTFRAAVKRDLPLDCVDRSLVDAYIQFLGDADTETSTQKGQYSATKAVLKALCRRGIIREVLAGDEATFPRNPFPGVHRKIKGERPMPSRERKLFSMAVKTEAMPIFSEGVDLTSELLSYAFLIVALHTGRNTWPLLEMPPDCLRSHPKDNTLFLVLYKRRGHSTSKAAVKGQRDFDLGIESMPTVRMSVVELINRVIDLTAPLRERAPMHLKDTVWLYQARTPARGLIAIGEIRPLSLGNLSRSVKILVKRHKLLDSDGRPMRINVSRLRKTFVNRIYEILDGDMAATAAAAGNTVDVASVSYLRPGEDAQRNWKFMGVALVRELLTATIGATERTPVGQCSDPLQGEYAPKRSDEPCMSFFNCLRCRNYVVTADDFYRLFSFYWRILRERSRMAQGRWKRQFSHIVRLIDRDVVEEGVAQGVFNQQDVDRERERARRDPHPFWSAGTSISDLEGVTR